MRKLTQEEFENKVFNLYGDEYTVVDNYVNGHVHLRFKHEPCGWIFESDPYNFLRGYAKCPICFSQMKKITQEIFEQKVKNLCGDEYSVVSEYHGANKPIMMRHNNCSCPDGFFEWETTPHNFMDGHHMCPYESRLYLDIDEVKRRLAKHHPDYTVLSEKYVFGEPVKIQCPNGHIYTSNIGNISAGNGCAYCAHQKIVIGETDLWTTHPEIAKHLVNADDGYKYSYGTKTSLEFYCFDCGEKVFRKPSEAMTASGRYVCRCSDGISYPEKFFVSLLSQLKIDYVTQLTRTTFDWCKDFRYDFYIPSIDTICEIHGMQHYRDCSWASLKETQENDKNKYQNAVDKVSNYIVIDARYSKPDFIKDSILNSSLSQLLDLTSISWAKCNQHANSSLVKSASDLWNSGVHNAVQIGEMIGVKSNTVLNYLDKATFSGMCDFDREQYRKDVNHGYKRIPVKCIETGVIYSSLTDVRNKLNINLTKNKILTNNKIGGFHWEIVD